MSIAAYGSKKRPAALGSMPHQDAGPNLVYVVRHVQHIGCCFTLRLLIAWLTVDATAPLVGATPEREHSPSFGMHVCFARMELENARGRHQRPLRGALPQPIQGECPILDQREGPDDGALAASPPLCLGLREPLHRGPPPLGDLIVVDMGPFRWTCPMCLIPLVLVAGRAP
ncbi:MAG: hypothetical protein M3319_09485 [Actinomycetota bacterium]|nr:hypothetical protein [Actinomycetota bacterium]